ncbi:MAG: hypothetical protein NZM65_04735 [Flavobacteriales bacterium]|nr:hypothetical protein [Flavobacteriales bacterium]MDW8409977.1 hypothetical protein [Flavobacteriales bacterium]
MKHRVTKGWNAIRVLYTALGGLIIVHSSRVGFGWGILFGAYFMLMGILAFGCAGGTCAGGYCSINPADTAGQQALPPQIHSLENKNTPQ